MDLRKFITTPSQIEQATKFVENGTLFYQPFILQDGLEVGEARNFCKRYDGVDNPFDLNVYSSKSIMRNWDRKFIYESEKDYFTKGNAEYRACYQEMRDAIIKYSGLDPKKMTVAEIGCNTGISLYYLALEGAKCSGYDWNDMSNVFGWLNSIMNVDVKFKRGVWDNLRHRFLVGDNEREVEFDIPEVDIMINTVYTNHQFDPLQFLAYICDRAKVGVMLQVLIDDKDECCLYFPSLPPHEEVIKGEHLPFPLNINNDMRMTKKLLFQTLNKLGFGEIISIRPDIKNLEWEYFLDAHRMFFVKRTSDIKSAFWTDK